MYDTLLSNIQSIKNSVSNIGGDYYYIPSTDVLYQLNIPPTGSIGSYFKYVGEWRPKYNGTVTIYNNTSDTSNYVAVWALSLANVDLPYSVGTSIENRINRIMNRSNLNSYDLTYFGLSVGRGAAVEMPVFASIPLYFYVAFSEKYEGLQVRGRAVKK